jgi:hypothetical protein
MGRRQNGLLVQRADIVPDTNDNQEGSAPQLLNSPPPEPPSSDGDIATYDAGLADNSVQAGIINNPDAQLTNRET